MGFNGIETRLLLIAFPTNGVELSLFTIKKHQPASFVFTKKILQKKHLTAQRTNNKQIKTYYF